ncbi:MAG: penicillin-binding protein activator LpoB [Calditrichaeota bacterium]|nr:MAG: penicillin-binding protein activator LpoB [Calditrichota bacterium]
MKPFKFLLFVIFLSPIVFNSCAGPSHAVTRLSVDEDRDLSGRWNDTDSRLVAEQMIDALLTHQWLGNFITQEDKNPVLIVGDVRNLSSEHIPVDIFIKDIERELINSGQVSFVANKFEREEVRAERLDQQLSATEETAKRLAAETGADFMLRGSLKNQVDAISGKKIKFYQVDLELIDLETNAKVWLETKKIKKLVKQPKASW